MELNGIINIPITAAGGTFTLSVDSKLNKAHGYVSGAVSLLANVVVTTSGTPVDGMTFEVSGNLKLLDLNGNTFTVFGETIDQDVITNAEFLVRSIYSSQAGKFITAVIPNFSSASFIDSGMLTSDSVSTVKIQDNALTYAKLQDFAARGYLLRGGVAGAPEEFDAKTSAQLVMGNGTDVTSIAMSGDVTISSSGVTTIGAGKVTPAMLSFSLSSYLEASLTIPTASVLTLNATPLTIVSAPGSGKYIEIISASCSMTYVSAAYATNTTLQLINEGATAAQLHNTAALIGTTTKNTKFIDATAAAAGGTQAITNTALQVKVATGDPTAGDSDIKVKVTYRIVTI